MIATDVLLLAALAAFVLAWWVRALPQRPAILVIAALIALAASVAGVADDRWQAGAGIVVAVLLLLALLVSRWRKPNARGAPIFSGAAFSLLAAVAAAPILLFPVDPLPNPAGPHAVGVRTFDLTDESRTGVLGAAANEPRRLLVRVWYPASTTQGQPRRYFTQAEARSTAHGLGALVGFPPFLSYLKHVRTNSYENAPLFADAAGLPVIFYSHGYMSFLGQNTALMEDLASHGYVVFALQHTYDSSPTVFADGAIAPLDPEILSGDSGPPSDAMRRAIVGSAIEDRLSGILDLFDEEIARGSRIAARSAPHWVLDRLFLHDQLQSGGAPASISEIVAASNLDRVGEMGMSFGGSTSGALCIIDARCAAGVNLDGADYHFLAFDTAMPTPFLMFHSDPELIYASMGAAEAQPRTFNEFSYEPIATAGENTDLYRFALRDTHHLGVSDFSLFVRRPVRDYLFGAAPGTVTTGAQNAFVRGFFDRYLRGQADAFPTPAATAYDDWVRRVDTSDIRTWWAQLPEAERAAFAERIAQARAATPSAAVAAARNPSD